MSALFLMITITQRFPQLQKDWSKRSKRPIRGRIAVDSQHQICIPTKKFLFLYSSRNRFTKEWENIFADYQISGLSSEVWHFVTKIGQNSHHFWAKLTKIGQNSLQVQDRKLEMTYLHLHFAFCSVSNFKLRRKKLFFCQRFQEFSLFSPRL